MGMQGEAIQSGPNQPLASDATKTAGGGTGEATIGGVLNSNTTQYSTPADTDQHDAMTYTLPANTLNSDGKTLRIIAFGKTGANANTKTIRIWFDGASSIGIVTTSSGGGWKLELLVARDGVGSQKRIGSSVLATASGSQYGDDTADETAGIIIKTTAQNGTASAGDVLVECMLVELLN